MTLFPSMPTTLMPLIDRAIRRNGMRDSTAQAPAKGRFAASKMILPVGTPFQLLNTFALFDPLHVDPPHADLPALTARLQPDPAAFRTRRPVVCGTGVRQDG